MSSLLEDIKSGKKLSLTKTYDPECKKTDNDYKERFKIEYYQTKDRYDKLHKMIIKYEAGHLDFRPSASLEIHKQQAEAMRKYLYMLEVRAELENIDL